MLRNATIWHIVCTLRGQIALIFGQLEVKSGPDEKQLLGATFVRTQIG
jgi:hypothetical protein